MRRTLVYPISGIDSGPHRTFRDIAVRRIARIPRVGF